MYTESFVMENIVTVYSEIEPLKTTMYDLSSINITLEDQLDIIIFPKQKKTWRDYAL